MSITYVGRSQAKEGLSNSLGEFFKTVVIPAVKSSPGCESVQLLQDQDDPHLFMVIETWASVDAHRASVRLIPPESIAHFKELVVTLPVGRYYRSLVEVL